MDLTDEQQPMAPNAAEAAPPPPTAPMAAAIMSDPSKTKWAVWLPIVISLSVALGRGISWLYAQYEASAKERADAATAHQKEMAEAAKAKAVANERLLNTYLIPIQLKLKLSLSVYQQLSERFLVPGYGILESYIKIAQEEGSEKVSLPYALITDLVGIDSQIDDLLEAYDPSHLTPTFKAESDKFLEHAHTYIVRFKALPGVVAAGGDLPTWKPFPAGFPSALEDEIAIRQNRAPEPKNKVAFIEAGSSAATTKPGREFSVVKRSGWSGSGGSPSEWCHEALRAVAAEYPNAAVSISSSGQVSAAGNRGFLAPRPEYQYSCEIKVRVP